VGIQADQLSALITKRLFQNVLTGVNASNPAYQVDISAGEVGADDGSDVIEVTTPLTVDITTIGAANGLDGGSEASDTWYYLFLIKNPATGAVAGLLSASSTSPTLPSGYTKKRLIGAVRNDGSSNFLPFIQAGKRVQYEDRQLVWSGALTSGFVAKDCSGVVPPVSRLAFLSINGTMTSGTGDGSVFIAHDIGAANGLYAVSLELSASATMEGLNAFDMVLDGSQQCFLKEGSSADIDAALWVQGFELLI
jgi:hypothetical protein